MLQIYYKDFVKNKTNRLKTSHFLSKITVIYWEKRRTIEKYFI